MGEQRPELDRADEVTLKGLLANAERARREAAETADETLRQQLLEVARRYEAMAKTFEVSVRQARAFSATLGRQASRSPPQRSRGE